MREYVLNLTPWFDKGLRADWRTKKGTPGLVEALNVKVLQHGIVPYEPVTVPISQDSLSLAGLVLNWPEPRLYRGAKRTIMSYRQDLFYVDERDWTFQQMEIYNYNSQASTIQPLAGGIWQMIDFYDTWLMTNGMGVVFHTNKEIALQGTDKIFWSHAMRATAGCAHRGRAVLAGFDPDKKWNAIFRTFASTGTNHALLTGTALKSADADGHLFKNLGDNFVLWSAIGGGDLLCFFDESVSNIFETGWLAGADYNVTNRPYFVEFLRRNDWGFMPMPWQGVVRQMKPLGKMVIAYGDGGVTALIPYSEPTPTYGMQHISSIGIACTGAVDGDDLQHVYIDQEGTLWTIDANLTATRLGYKEWLQDMLGTDIVVTFNPQYREWYICNGFKTLLLTQSGLTRCGQLVTSGFWAQGAMLGLGQHETAMNRQAIVVTDSFNMGTQAIKKLGYVEIGFRDKSVFEAVQVAVDYRYQHTNDFIRTPFRSINREGMVYFPVSGCEMRLVLKYADFENAEPPDYCYVRWQLSDKRYVRGQHAGATAAESNS
jgi:hypothetical protein